MGHTWKDVSHFKNVSQLKNWSPYEKCVTLGKRCRSWQNESHLKKNESRLEKWVTSGKWVTQLNSSEWLTLGKGVTIKKKWVTLGKVGHSQRNGSHLWKCSHLEKWVTLAKMGDSQKMSPTWNNGSHMEKWTTFKTKGSHLIRAGQT